MTFRKIEKGNHMNARERMEAFRKDLVALVNQHIHATAIHPEDVARVFAEEATTALDHLPWTPPPQRAAREHFVTATACLRDGAAIPVPGFAVLFPESATDATVAQ
jgi:hypothetical protein